MLIKLLRCALLLSVALAASGCAGFFGTPTPKIKIVDTSTRSFKPHTARRNDTCASQREVAAHNSVYDTLKKKRRVVYCARCDCPELYKSDPAKVEAPKKVKADKAKRAEGAS